MEKIAIVRSASSTVSKNQYNIQEIGLAKELAKLGMIVDVFLISDKETTYSEKCGLKNRVTVYWLKGIKLPGQQGYYKDLKKILDNNRYDLIQALDDSQLTTVLVSQYCNKNNIKFVLWQGMYENYPEKYKRLIQYVFDWTLLRILRKNTNYSISKTTSARDYLLEKKFDEVKVIPVALETENFIGNQIIDYRRKLNIPDYMKVLLYVGKVEERRKPFFCLDLYNRIKTEHCDCCLVYVGKGPMLEQTREYATKHKIQDVYFIDQIPQRELSSLYEISELFILPTRYEIFGMVLIEAMYFGTPVITYSAAGPIDVISDQIDGLLLSNFDIESWAQKIKKSIFLENKSKEMGILGKIKIEEKYRWPVVAKEYCKEYRRIINN
ncbi:MAG: hypothetical protein PWP62_2286 [Eubacteriaceae bacterium]|nr:hypothetical protein [Eubacteriaceae bacterium]